METNTQNNTNPSQPSSVSNSNATTPIAKPLAAIETNVLAVFAYLLGFIFAGVIIFLLEKDRKFVRFHALQSALYFAVVYVANYIVGTVMTSFWLLAPIIGLLWLPFGLGAFLVWLFLMWKAYNNQEYQLPIIGPFAKKQVYQS